MTAGEDQAREVQLVSAPPANLVDTCEKLAGHVEGLPAVYCLPVLPPGPVEIERHGTGAGTGQYIVSLHTEPDAMLAPEGPLPNPNGSELPPIVGDERVMAIETATGHVVFAADEEAGRIERAVAGPEPESSVERFKRGSVEIALRTGPSAGLGFQSQGHAIAHWRMGDADYLISAHWDENAPAVREMAIAMVDQMLECPIDRRTAGDSSSAACEWVYPVHEGG